MSQTASNFCFRFSGRVPGNSQFRTWKRGHYPASCTELQGLASGTSSSARVLGILCVTDSFASPQLCAGCNPILDRRERCRLSEVFSEPCSATTLLSCTSPTAPRPGKSITVDHRKTCASNRFVATLRAASSYHYGVIRQAWMFLEKVRLYAVGDELVQKGFFMSDVRH